MPDFRTAQHGSDRSPADSEHVLACHCCRYMEGGDLFNALHRGNKGNLTWYKRWAAPRRQRSWFGDARQPRLTCIHFAAVQT